MSVIQTGVNHHLIILLISSIVLYDDNNWVVIILLSVSWKERVEDKCFHERLIFMDGLLLRQCQL